MNEGKKRKKKKKFTIQGKRKVKISDRDDVRNTYKIIENSHSNRKIGKIYHENRTKYKRKMKKIYKRQIKASKNCRKK